MTSHLVESGIRVGSTGPKEKTDMTTATEPVKVVELRRKALAPDTEATKEMTERFLGLPLAALHWSESIQRKEARRAEVIASRALVDQPALG